MQIAKKTVLTNTARTTLGINARSVEDALLELHKNDNDNFAIGDIKLSSRTISDTNWKKCDGSFLRTALSSDIRKNLFQTASFAAKNFSTNPTNVETLYADDTYLITSYTVNPGTTTSGTRAVYLQIFTRNSAGNPVLNSTKTIASTSTVRIRYDSGDIVKAGNYYYFIYRYYHIAADDSDDQTIYVAYTTSPTGTWTNKTLVANNVVASGRTYYNYLGAYASGSNVRADFIDKTNGSSATVTSLAFTTTVSNITTTTQTSAPAMTYSNWGSSHERYKIHSDNGNRCFREGPSYQYLTYKSSFTANWQNLTSPSWAQSLNIPWIGYYYIDSVHWGVFDKQGQTIIVGANSLSDLQNLARTSLPYNFTINHGNTAYSVTYGAHGETPYGVTGYTVDANNGLYVWCVNKSGMTTSDKLISLPAAPQNSRACIAPYISDYYATGIFKYKLDDTTAFMTALALPNIKLSGATGYIKIANN